MEYWLIKSEPEAYSIADLQRQGTTLWDGVRNYQARNFLKAMALGDRAFFYHSNTKPPAIIGLAEVIGTQLVDPSQFEVDGPYYDPQATIERPRWHTAQFKYLQTYSHGLSLAQLREHFTPEELAVVRPGNRLSVMPVGPATAQKLLALLDSPGTTG
jgi:predicted RNA-binding protein with PUA-like domain